MHDALSSREDVGLLDLALRLAHVAESVISDRCSVYRNGLRFEKSGGSMAVFQKDSDGSEHRVDRVDLPDESDLEFLIAIDKWLFNRYKDEVA